MPPVTPEARLSPDELVALRDFAELRISASQLEAALSPYLKITWTGQHQDQVEAVTLEGVTVKPHERVVISPAVLERAQTLATSHSPKDRQAAAEWVEVITKLSVFTADSNVVKELYWLGKQVRL